jgi:hypothetical protein
MPLSNRLRGTVRLLTVLARRLEVVDMLVVTYLIKLDINHSTNLTVEMLGCGY